jgi:predicted RND superfamily exporter protein
MLFSHFVLLLIMLKSNMSNEQDFLNQDEYAKELKQYFLDLSSSSKSKIIVTTTSSSSSSSLEAMASLKKHLSEENGIGISSSSSQLTTTHYLTKKITHLSQDEYAKELSFLKKNKWSSELTTPSFSPKSSFITNKATSHSKVKYFFIYFKGQVYILFKLFSYSRFLLN